MDYIYEIDTDGGAIPKRIAPSRRAEPKQVPRLSTSSTALDDKQVHSKGWCDHANFDYHQHENAPEQHVIAQIKNNRCDHWQRDDHHAKAVHDRQIDKKGEHQPPEDQCIDHCGCGCRFRKDAQD